MGKSALNKLLAQLQAVKKEAIAKGVQAITSVAAIPAVAVALEPEPENNDAAPICTRTLVLREIGQYNEAIKKLPRQLLEARYTKDIGEPCPPAPREWLIEKMGRKVQNEAYMKYEGEIPQSVLRYNRIFAIQKPRMMTEDDADNDDDEPSKSDRKFDATMRAKALIGNPFSRGFAFTLFALVESQPNGIQYNALVMLLKTMFDWAQVRAEAKAQKVFTKWVDKGWVELL